MVGLTPQMVGFITKMLSLNIQTVLCYHSDHRLLHSDGIGFSTEMVDFTTQVIGFSV